MCVNSCAELSIAGTVSVRANVTRRDARGECHGGVSQILEVSTGRNGIECEAIEAYVGTSTSCIEEHADVDRQVRRRTLRFWQLEKVSTREGTSVRGTGSRRDAGQQRTRDQDEPHASLCRVTTIE